MNANKTKTRMKKSTLRFNSGAFRVIFCSTVSFFTFFNVFSQEQNSVNEKQTIHVPVFQSEVERQEWIKNHPEEYQLMLSKKVATANKEILPSDFPKFVNTGNPELDNQNYSKLKQEWISTHQEEYKKMQEPTSSSINTKNN